MASHRPNEALLLNLDLYMAFVIQKENVTGEEAMKKLLL